MADWERLRVDLLRYVEEAPGAVVSGPSPHTERRYERRFRIELAACAVEIAGDLHAAPVTTPRRTSW